jgi:GNAT superfamily N-acetyltransferase
MKDASRYGVLVAVLPQDEVAGWIGAYVFPSVVLDPFAVISGFVVDESLRSRGIGKALLNAAEDWARRVGCAALSVNSNIIRDRAHHF